MMQQLYGCMMQQLYGSFSWLNFVTGDSFCCFCPTKEKDGTWRIKTNVELDKLIRHKNVINYMKTQRISWFGHLRVHRMPEERMVKEKYISGIRC
jgi:hypothetical protein